MDKKEIKITIPKGYEIDKENSTFEKIVFKKVKVEPKRWRGDDTQPLNGYYIDDSCNLRFIGTFNNKNNYNVFATKKQAKSALAMARISQIMANDKRFGGVISDEEWKDGTIIKHVISRNGKEIRLQLWNACYHFLAFHTKEQCKLFLNENEDLVKDYLMIE